MMNKTNYQSFRSFLIPTLSYICMLSLSLWLGFWQMERLEWKETLLNNLNKTWSKSPKLLSKELEIFKGKKIFKNASQEYPKALLKHDLTLNSVKGVFLPQHIYYRVHHHKKIGKSFDIFTVMQLEEPFKAILPVIIGTIAINKKDHFKMPQKSLMVTGFFRKPYQNTHLIQNKSLVSNTPYMSLSKEFGSDLLPFTLTLSQHNTPIKDLYYFKTEEFIRKIPNNHYSYMLTWFILSGILTIFYTLWIKKNIFKS